jgi:hypothetical protein
MPAFCRHSRLIQNCPICSKEQKVEMRPVVTSSAPKVSLPRERSAGDGSSPSPRPPRAGGRGAGASGGSRSGVRVRHLARGAEDGFTARLVPGLRSSEDAARLTEELVFAAGRLALLATDPPGLFADVADSASPIEERVWLAFLIAYMGPLDPAANGSDSSGEDPFASIAAVRVPWTEVDTLDLSAAVAGPRGAHNPDRGLATVEAYRAWVGRSGSQQAAFTGETSWTPERRYERIFERLGTLPGMSRDARVELLTLLGALGVCDVSAGKVCFGGENEVTWAGKRALGIGDPLLLERRAADLAADCGVPVGALDLGLHNWGAGHRFGDGAPTNVELDEGALHVARRALGLPATDAELSA